MSVCLSGLLLYSFSSFLSAGVLLLLLFVCVTVWYYRVVQAQRGLVLCLGSEPAKRGPGWTKYHELA